MPKDSLGDKLERQYENIKGGLKDIAQKVTAEDPEPRTDAMAGRAGGTAARARGTTRSAVSKSRSAGSKAASKTGSAASKSKEELYADAKRLGVKGRSKMTKDQLAKAVRRG